MVLEAFCRLIVDQLIDRWKAPQGDGRLLNCGTKKAVDFGTKVTKESIPAASHFSRTLEARRNCWPSLA